jgi:hypothetical protein
LLRNDEKTRKTAVSRSRGHDRKSVIARSESDEAIQGRRVGAGFFALLAMTTKQTTKSPAENRGVFVDAKAFARKS